MHAPEEIKGSALSHIASGALTVMAAFIVSNLIGLLAKTLTARYFGTGVESSAFFAANRFSEILFSLVAGGALGSAFIPVFTGMLVKGDRQNAWKLASSIINIVTAVLILLSILTILFSESVVHYLLAPGFNAADTALTARLLRIQVLSSIIFGMSGLVMAILNSHQHFLLPAIAPAMYQAGWIFGILVLSPTKGIDGLAWGVVIGAFFHLIVQLPLILRLKDCSYSLGFGLWMAEVKEVARLMAPRLLGVAIIQLNFLLNTYLASFQLAGAITAISLAFPLMIMPEAAIAQSIAIAALPTFSALVAKGDINEMRQTLAATLRAVILLSIPASVGLVMLRKPIVQLLYGGQAFGARSVDLVAWALLWYAVGLVGHSIVEVSSRAFYALHDTRTPVIVGVGAMLANLGLSFLFSALFTRIGWMPHGGLALANSTATAVESVILLVLMKKKLAGIAEAQIINALWKSVLASVIMGLLIYWIGIVFAGQALLAPTAISIFTGVLSYILVLIVLKTPEVNKIIAMIKAKVSRKA
jgi:putative peptidoglycan lipid II flippase